MEKDIKYYSLYENKDQKKLLAAAYSKEELKEVSLEYTGGTWFEYDVEIEEGKTDLMYNERLYKGRPKFAAEINIKEETKDDEDEFALKSSIGDLR